MRRMLITPMFSVVAEKSGTFSSLPYSADEQVCRSWEGAQPGSQPNIATGNIPYHRHHVQFMNGVWLEGRNPFLVLLFSRSSNLLFSQSSVFFMKSVSSGFHGPCSRISYTSVTGW